MQVYHKEACRTDPNCEVRHGTSTWDAAELAIKYAWFASNGHVARGGEYPEAAAPQMLEMMVRLGKELKLTDPHGNPVQGGELLLGLLQTLLRCGCQLSFV